MTAMAGQDPIRDWSRVALRLSGIALVGVVWISSAIFGAYIVAYYGGAIPANTLEDWNAQLPRLFEAQTPVASSGMGLHFMAGAVLLLLGPVQLFSGVRAMAPALHRWIGRIYAFAAFSAGVGGLTFIALKGTVGGWPMTLGFALYGAGMVLASITTVGYAMKRQFAIHRAWAIRLYALAIGSWLYRMGYGFFYLFAGHDNPGHTPDFRGWFDVFMDFAFYVFPLIVAEMFIRGRRTEASAIQRSTAAAGLSISALMIALATFFFTLYGWGPAILSRFGGA